MAEEKTTARLRVCLSGVCNNAARTIDELTALLKGRMSVVEFEQMLDDLQPAADVALLRHVSRHVRETSEGKHTVARFAEHYCVAPDPEGT